MLLSVKVRIAVLIRRHEIYYTGNRKRSTPCEIVLRRLALKMRLHRRGSLFLILACAAWKKLKLRS